MHNDLIEAGWTDDHWNRIVGAVAEEAQRARTAAQIVPVVGPEDGTMESFADFRLNAPLNPNAPPQRRLGTDNVANHPFTTIGVQVALRSTEVADPALEGALVKFRRAANIVARLEDAVVFNDRTAAGAPWMGVGAIPPVYRVTGGGPPAGQLVELGLLPLDMGPLGATPVAPRLRVPLGLPAVLPVPAVPAVANLVVTGIIQAMSLLENAGQSRPFACALSPYLYEAVYVPNNNFVAAKDRILPILNGPLVRSSAITDTDPFGARVPYGVVIALGGNPLSIRVVSDIGVRFLQATAEPRFLFRVSERIGLRVSDPTAVAVLVPR